LPYQLVNFLTYQLKEKVDRGKRTDKMVDRGKRTDKMSFLRNLSSRKRGAGIYGVNPVLRFTPAGIQKNGKLKMTSGFLIKSGMTS